MRDYRPPLWLAVLLLSVLAVAAVWIAIAQESDVTVWEITTPQVKWLGNPIIYVEGAGPVAIENYECGVDTAGYMICREVPVGEAER